MHIVTKSSRRYLALAAAAALLAAGGVQAQTAAAPAAPAAHVAHAQHAAQRLTIREIYDRVEAAGYRDQREIELDDGRYEVKARNAQGERVKLKVNAQTGAVEHIRVRKRKHHD